MDQLHASLTDLLGGAGSVDAVVDDLYRRILDDPLLNRWFVDVEMTAQRRHMAATLLSVLGAPSERATRAVRHQLVSAHAHLRITDDVFDRTAGHLLDALAGLGVDPHLTDDVIVRLAALRPQVVDPVGAPPSPASDAVPTPEVGTVPEL